MLVNILKLWDKCNKYPMGKQVFSFLFCLKAPYFLTILPLVENLKPGHASVSLKQRWILQNMIQRYY